MNRIRLIERSLRCFVLGWVGLVPLLGLGPAVMAITLFLEIRRENATEWNPAGRYLLAGVVLGSLGILVPTLGLLCFMLGYFLDWWLGSA